jgi:hypothetical protein
VGTKAAAGESRTAPSEGLATAARGAEEPRTATALTPTAHKEEELRKATAGLTTNTHEAAARSEGDSRSATAFTPAARRDKEPNEETTGETTMAIRTAPEWERGTSTPAVGLRTSRKKARAARDEKSAGEGKAGRKVDEADTEGGMVETTRSGRRSSCSSS